MSAPCYPPLFQFNTHVRLSELSAALDYLATLGDHRFYPHHGHPDDPRQQANRTRGRKICFRLGLLIYGVRTVIAAASKEHLTVVAGYSLGEGIGTALLFPPVYILATVLTTDVKSRARAFDAISAAAASGMTGNWSVIYGPRSWLLRLPSFRYRLSQVGSLPSKQRMSVILPYRPWMGRSLSRIQSNLARPA
jgi:hypothetical protein